MWGRHVGRNLSAFAEGELGSEQTQRVARHLERCARCRAELEAVRLAIRLSRCLPAASAPDSLWQRIEARLEPQRENLPAAPMAAARRTPRRLVLAATSVAVILGGTALWRAAAPERLVRPSWAVTPLAGAPRVGDTRLGGAGRLPVGSWLETDNASRARIAVADIGNVEVEPNSRVRLVETRPREHRLALVRGTLSAVISAPPRLFFVDTPSAVAVDLGCAYTLEVDARGGGLLRVRAGHVAFEHAGRESIVPAGALCRTQPGIGPGTPVFEDAPVRLRHALEQLDFGSGGAEALTAVLAAARPRDTLTLWHLLPRAAVSGRGRVFDRLAALAAPPPGVTRAAVLRLDPGALARWRADLEAAWSSWPDGFTIFDLLGPDAAERISFDAGGSKIKGMPDTP